jgi:hypothetical protein
MSCFAAFQNLPFPLVGKDGFSLLARSAKKSRKLSHNSLIRAALLIREQEFSAALRDFVQRGFAR